MARGNSISERERNAYLRVFKWVRVGGKLLAYCWRVIRPQDLFKVAILLFFFSKNSWVASLNNFYNR